MTDIVDRLRSWVYTDALYATAREAADEIERLRHVVQRKNLSDAEREAVETCIADDEAMTHHSRAATLRGLLERTSSPQNTQDQRLATADATTPADGIASPLHPLVLLPCNSLTNR